MTVKWNKVAIVGVGLIGGSIGQSLLRRNLAGHVVGIGRSSGRLALAEQLRAISSHTTSLAEGVTDADVTVVCTPVESIADLVLEVSAQCPPTALITDAGSAKAKIVATVDREHVPGRGEFVGSHPLAGSDRAGVRYADAELLVNRLVVVTPGRTTSQSATRRVEGFWQDLGARVARMSAESHDQAIAATSHVPHAIASILAAVTPEDYLPLTSTGWQDTTRVAAGDVELWRQILSQNQPSVLKCLREFGKVLNSFTDALERGDDQALSDLLTAGKNRRDALAD